MSTQEDRQHDMEIDMREMLQEMAELRTTLVGMDGNNGLRSQIATLRKEFNTFVDEFKKYKYEERPITCLGIKAVETLRKELKEKEVKEKADMKLDKETMVALEKIAQDARNSRRTNIVTIIGLFLVFVANIAPYVFG